MKKLILAGLLLLSLTALGQGLSHCLPLNESRILHELALKSISLDSMLVNREDRIIILVESIASQHESFMDQLSVEREKLQIQTEITAHQESVSNSFKEENEYLQKQIRRLKWQRVGLGVIAVAVIGLSL